MRPIDDPLFVHAVQTGLLLLARHPTSTTIGQYTGEEWIFHVMDGIQHERDRTFTHNVTGCLFFASVPSALHSDCDLFALAPAEKMRLKEGLIHLPGSCGRGPAFCLATPSDLVSAEQRPHAHHGCKNPLIFPVLGGRHAYVF